jgi:hypothetical protein
MTGFGTDHLKSIKRYVFELQPRRVYHWSKLSETKTHILSLLSSQTISTTGELLYKSQGNYSCRHTVPALLPDKKENTSIFSTFAQFILFLLYSTHSNQPKKIKTEPRYSISAAKHEDGELCCLLLQIDFISDFDKVWQCQRTVKFFNKISFYITSDHQSFQCTRSTYCSECTHLCRIVRFLNLIHNVQRDRSLYVCPTGVSVVTCCPSVYT